MLDPDDLVRVARRAGRFVLDIETIDVRTGRGGLDPSNGRITVLAFSVGDQTALYDFRAGGGSNWVRTMQELAPMFADPEVLWINHNVKFDFKWMVRHGTKVNNRLACTQVASWMLNEDRAFMAFEPGKRAQKYGLKKLVLEKYNHRMNTFSDTREEGNLFGPALVEYAPDDAKWTWRLWHDYEAELKADEIYSIFEKIEMPLLPILADMENTGILLDRKLMRGFRQQLEIKQKTVEAEIQEMVGKPFMISSSRDVADILYNEVGLPLDDEDRPVPIGKSGQASTGNKVLEQFEGNFPVVRKILEWRHLNVLQNTFCTKLANLASEKRSSDHRIRANFNQTGTRIGRLSSSEPNMQNMPRPEEDKNDEEAKHFSIRGAFIAETGNLLVDADLSQIELRMMAHWSHDPIMTAVYRADGKCPVSCGKKKCGHVDIHQATSDKIGCVRNPVAKNINFGACYRIGPKKLQSYARVDNVEDARHFLDSWYKTYKGVVDFHNWVEFDLLRNNHWVAKTITGRKRRLLKEKSINEYKAVTQGIQFIISGSSQDLLKIGMRNLWNGIRERAKEDPRWAKVHFLSQVHDEILTEAPQEIAEDVLKLKIHCMETADSGKLWVPVRAEGGVGPRWTDAH